MKSRGEIFSQKIWIWEGFRREFGSRLNAKLQIPQTKFPSESLPTHKFLIKNSPSDGTTLLDLLTFGQFNTESILGQKLEEVGRGGGHSNPGHTKDQNVHKSS